MPERAVQGPDKRGPSIPSSTLPTQPRPALLAKHCQVQESRPISSMAWATTALPLLLPEPLLSRLFVQVRSKNVKQRHPWPWYHRYMSPTNLRKLRERLGLSQQGLARRLGVARATVTRWENGQRRPSKVVALALRSVIEARDTRSWQQLAGAALNELWDNPEDAAYDAWQERYGSVAR